MRQSIIKYFFVTIILLIQMVIMWYAHNQTNNAIHLIKVFSDNWTGAHFTDKGFQSLKKSYACLNDSAISVWGLKSPQAADDDVTEICFLAESAKNFPIHLMQTRRKSNYIEIDVLYNVPAPFTITYKMVPVNGRYEIDEVKNVCKLFKAINPYFGEQESK